MTSSVDNNNIQVEKVCFIEDNNSKTLPSVWVNVSKLNVPKF